MTILLWLLAGLLVIVGLLGIVLPALPGTVMVFAGLVVAAWADHFTRVGAGTLVVLGILTAASYTIDFAAAAIGAKRFGASRRAIVGASLGTIFGALFGLVGLIVGPFVGAVIGELSTHRDFGRAGRIGLAAWIGFVIGTALKIAVVFAMIGIFLAALFLF